jgi:EAL domain-containing protein (putative c-di-GMP-specific phosphodiesterase class I)/DICT domain-containing protein
MSTVTTTNVTVQAEEAELDRILAARDLTPVYQPIVDLVSGEVVAYEALARGPEGSPLAGPAALFATAGRTGRLAELDWLCRARALELALDAELAAPTVLFVNVEPEVLLTNPPAGTEALLRTAARRLRVVVELTERALTDRPADLLAMVEAVRRQGWGIALDDVGADPRSLALVALLRPDVVKLDLALVQRRPDPDIAEIVAGVSAYAESSGAVVLAEGIETPAHRQTAEGMGARLGQGWLLGRPAPLPGPEDRRLHSAALHPALAGTWTLSGDRSAALTGQSPYELVAAARGEALRTTTKPLLHAMSVYLENQAAGLGHHAVVVAAFQHADYFTPASARRYTRLAESAAFVGVLGEGLAATPAPGARGGHLDPADPLRGEWDVAVVGPHFAATLVARDLGDTGPDHTRRFEYLLSYDRDLAVAVARTLMARLG